MKGYKTKLIILSRKDFSESDRILTVYSLIYGRHKIIAKGSRKTLAHLGGKIEPYYILFANLVEGKTFDILTEAEIISSFEELRNDFSRLSVAYQMSYLINNLLPEKQPNQKIYFLLENFLQNLNSKNFYLGWNVLLAELIFELGYHPNLEKCAICHQNLQLPISWHINEGFCHKRCSPIAEVLTDDEAKIIKLILFGDEIIMKIKISEKIINQIENYFEQYLAFHTGLEISKIRKENHGVFGN